MTLLAIAPRPQGKRWYALWTWSAWSHTSGFLRNDSSALALASMPNAPLFSVSLSPSLSRSLPSFVEAETGKGADALERRPELAAALSAAKMAKCCVVVAKLDRLSRDVAF